jgi:hypothetical protein
LISKNKKLIKEKFKIFSIAPTRLLIHSNDLISILKESLYNINLTDGQWELIINIGKKMVTQNLLILKLLITIIEYASKII